MSKADIAILLAIALDPFVFVPAIIIGAIRRTWAVNTRRSLGLTQICCR